ncbi:MAG: hypothetical protein ACOX00_00755 [Peptoniphilaceae bacterium]
MIDIEGQVEGNLVGLAYSLKGVDRFSEKIKADAEEMSLSLLETDKKSTDVLRYTMAIDESKFTDGYLKTVESLVRKGYNEIRVKNTFLEGAPYKGINTLLSDTAGNIFELQYHTPKSHEIKESVLHKLYEKSRTSTDVSEQKQLDAEMVRVSNDIPNPINVDRIKNILKIKDE